MLTTTLTPKEIFKDLQKHVIGQEEAKKVLAVAMYNHMKRVNNPHLQLEKSNILLIGPSGCGKTLLAKQLAKLFSVPFTMADATSLTESGYVGDDVQNVLHDLYRAADNNMKLAEQGIVFIDEVDKLRKRATSASTTANVGNEGVQQGLLKMIEGHNVKMQEDGGRFNTSRPAIPMNTDNILFIFSGAFVGLSFENEGQVSADDLIKYGMIPEFVGRIPVISKLTDLTPAELRRVLVEPENNVISQYTRQLLADGMTLSFTAGALDAVVEEAIKRKSGARGLRSIIEKAMLNIMYEAPSLQGEVSQVIVTPETILSGGKAEFKKKRKSRGRPRKQQRVSEPSYSSHQTAKVEERAC